MDIVPTDLWLRRATSPWQPSPASAPLDDVRALLRTRSAAVFVTGAGISTDSGIPDYRGPDAARATPMLYQEFIHDPEARRRYWARSFVGWQRTWDKQPNEGHRALARWAATSAPCPVLGIITQNVDGLHDAAGSRPVIPLHGRLADVICLDCGTVSSRQRYQDRLSAANPTFTLPDDDPGLRHPELRPDGDAVVTRWAGFEIPPCEVCGGLIKPDVVFFGETVPKPRVAQAQAWVDEADVVITAGTSLTVMSGLRFVRQAHRRGIPIVIINRGATRGDEFATFTVDGGTSQVLTELAG